jgi:hypothetical protein
LKGKLSAQSSGKKIRIWSMKMLAFQQIGHDT